MRLRASDHHCPAPPCISNHITARSHWDSGMWTCLGVCRAAWASLPKQYSPCTHQCPIEMCCAMCPWTKGSQGETRLGCVLMVLWLSPLSLRGDTIAGGQLVRVSAQDTALLLLTALNISRGHSLGLRHQALGRHQAFLLYTRPAHPWGGGYK